MQRKFLVTLILLLFLFPFVSWYYLRQGLNWRKEAQEVMQGTDPFPEGKWLDSQGIILHSKDLEGHVTLLAIVPCDLNANDHDAFIAKVSGQFNETKKAKYVFFDTCTYQRPSDFANTAEMFSFHCPDVPMLCDSLLFTWPGGKSYALVDRHGVIRSYYSIRTEEEKRILVEHMALLLPRERSEKVELKRGINQ